MKFTSQEEYDFLLSNEITRIDLLYKLDIIKNDLLKDLENNIENTSPNNIYSLEKYNNILNSVISLLK